MRKIVVTVMLLWCLAGAVTRLKAQTAKSTQVVASPPVEAQVRKLWQAFKNKDKATLSSLLDDEFRMFEEGLSTFADKKAEVNAVDEYDLLNYTLSDFTVKKTGPNTALVTYIAQYEGKSGGEVSKAKSVFGEVWVHAAGEWKALYLQETYMK